MIQETIATQREVGTEDLLEDLRRDFPDYRATFARFGWIAIDMSVDVTVRLKVRKKGITLYARRRATPSILGILFGGGSLSEHAEQELTRELDHEQKRVSHWIRSKYGAPVT